MSTWFPSELLNKKETNAISFLLAGIDVWVIQIMWFLPNPNEYFALYHSSAKPRRGVKKTQNI